MMNTQTRPAGNAVRILADHRADKRLGNWTTSRDFEIRSRHGRVVLDLRSPQIPEGDIQIDLDLDCSAVTLLVAGDAVIDQWELAWTGGGKVKQTFHHPAASPGADDPAHRAHPPRRGPGAQRRDRAAVSHLLAGVCGRRPPGPR